MGIFNFLKKTKPKPVTFEEIQDWLDDYVEAQKISDQIALIKREIKAKKSRLNSLLVELENTVLHDKKVIPERELTIFEGNRSTYINKIRLFLTNLEVPEKYDDAIDFLKLSTEKLEELAQNTQKNFFIVKEFTGHEVSRVASKLLEFDKLISSAIEQLDDNSLNKVDEIKQLVKDFYNKETEIRRLQRESELIEKTKLEFYEKKEGIQSKINKLKSNPAFEEFKSLKEKLIVKKEDLKSNIYKLHKIKSNLESAIKKFVKINSKSILKRYLDEPVEALIKDEKLDVLKELEKLKKNVSKLNLKPEKEKRILKELNVLSKKKLDGMQKNIIQLKEDVQNLEKRIKNNITNLNIKEQSGWLDLIDKSLMEEDEKIQKIEDQIERINLALIKQKIKKLVQELKPNTEFE